MSGFGVDQELSRFLWPTLEVGAGRRASRARRKVLTAHFNPRIGLATDEVYVHEGLPRKISNSQNDHPLAGFRARDYASNLL